jgi:hypothetical protein
MHDHYTVHSTDGQIHYTRLVIAGGAEDAWRTHQTHYPDLTVLAIRQGRSEDRA